MMSKPKAPIHSYKKPAIYYQNDFQLSNKKFGNFYRGPQTSFCNSEPNPVPARNKYKYILIKIFNNWLEKCLENYISKDAMKPNFEMVGITNLPTNKKIIFSSKFEFNIMDNNVEYYDQQLGAVHPRLSHIEIKGIKICTIILISIMILVQSFVKN